MTSRPKHAAQNAAAVELRLTPEEVERIDAAFPLGPLSAVLPTL